MFESILELSNPFIFLPALVFTLIFIYALILELKNQAKVVHQKSEDKKYGLPESYHHLDQRYLGREV